MGCFLFKSELAVKVALVFIVWLFRYFSRRVHASDDLESNEELDEDAYEYEEQEEDDAYEEDDDEIDDQPPAPIRASPVVQANPTPAFNRVGLQPLPYTSKLVEERKAALVRKRKLFRNGLLMDALMHRKDLGG